MSESIKLSRHAKALSWSVCLGGLLALNLALVPSVRAAEQAKPDACYLNTANPTACWCAAHETQRECLFDSECQTIYKDICKSAP